MKVTSSSNTRLARLLKIILECHMEIVLEWREGKLQQDSGGQQFLIYSVHSLLAMYKSLLCIESYEITSTAEDILKLSKGELLARQCADITFTVDFTWCKSVNFEIRFG